MSSSTRSGKQYGHPGKDDVAAISETPIQIDTEEIETITLDLDSEPFFRAALATDSQRGRDESDDCEGHELTSTSSQESRAPHPSQPVRKPMSATLKIRKAKASKDRRRTQAARKAQEFPKLPPLYRPRLAILRLCNTITHTLSNLCSEDLPAASGGWVGKRVVISQNTTAELKKLKAKGFSTLAWKGCKPHVITDKKKRIMVALAGKPSDVDWNKVIHDASDVMTSVRDLALAAGVFKSAQSHHRRGNFYQLPTGVSFGGGSKRPGNLAHTVGEKKALTRLLAHRAIRRIVGFQHTSFALYAPKLYEHYRKTLALLYAHEPHLQPNFPTISPFPAMTFNLGPSTATVEHTDAGNVAYGWCAITALGNYNPEKEGHLILYDLKLIITFPPGSTVLIPSAVFRHGNTPLVEAGSIRQSITQYCAGGLFRWTRYGFRTAKELLETDPSGRIRREADGDLQTKTSEALSLFSTLDSLATDRAQVLRRS